jgi:hypothetical protein
MLAAGYRVVECDIALSKAASNFVIYFSLEAERLKAPHWKFGYGRFRLWPPPRRGTGVDNALFEVEQVKQLALNAPCRPIMTNLRGRIPAADGITVRRKSRALFQQHRSITSFRACGNHFQYWFNSGRIAALSRLRPNF